MLVPVPKQREAIARMRVLRPNGVPLGEISVEMRAQGVKISCDGVKGALVLDRRCARPPSSLWWRGVRHPAGIATLSKNVPSWVASRKCDLGSGTDLSPMSRVDRVEIIE
jgi:hypothetical protein